MTYYLGILVLSVLVENFVLAQFLGICPFLGVSKKLNTAVGMSLAVIFVMVLATAVTYPIYQWILLPNNMASSDHSLYFGHCGPCSACGNNP